MSFTAENWRGRPLGSGTALFASDEPSPRLAWAEEPGPVVRSSWPVLKELSSLRNPPLPTSSLNDTEMRLAFFHGFLALGLTVHVFAQGDLYADVDCETDVSCHSGLCTYVQNLGKRACVAKYLPDGQPCSQRYQREDCRR